MMCLFMYRYMYIKKNLLYYLSDLNIKSLDNLAISLKNANIEYNIVVVQYCHQLMLIGGPLFRRKKGSMPDFNF